MSTQDITSAIEELVQEQVRELKGLHDRNAHDWSKERKAFSLAVEKLRFKVDSLEKELEAAYMALKATGARPNDYPHHAGPIYAAQNATESQLPPRDRCFLVVTTKVSVAAVFSNYEDAKEHLRTFKPYHSAELYGRL